MSDTDRWTKIGPYAERLLEDENVHEGIRRLISAFLGAYGRARDKKRKRDAITDRGVQRRLREAADAAREVIVAISEAPRVQRRRRRRRTLTVLLAGGAVVTVAASRPVREELSQLFRSDGKLSPTSVDAPRADGVRGG